LCIHNILGYKNKSELFFNNEYNLIDRLDHIHEVINYIENLTKNLIDKSEKTFQVFSDSIIITYPTGKDGLSCLLHDINVISANCSIHDLFIRGGISKGKHINIKTKKSKLLFLASDALQKAYELEQEAKMPRVLIDSSLVKDFSNIDKCNVIKENNDYIAHFAPQLINREGNNESDVISEMNEIFIRLNEESEDSIKEKYQWILDYYYWTIKSSNGFDIKKFDKFKSEKEYNFKKY